MLKNKVIFLDLDGTFLDNTLKAPASAVEAFRKAKENGHRIYINTGRSVCQIYDHLWELGFDGFIGGNGIYIEKNGEPLFHHPIPQELVVKVHQYLLDQKIGFFEEGNHSLYAHTSYLPALMRLLGITEEEAKAETDKIFPTTHYNCTDWHENVNKISIVLTDDVDIEAVREFIKPDLTLGQWSMIRKEREFADIYQSGASKGSAVEIVMEHLGLPLSDAFCFGDSDNDIEMLQTAGFGVAMGNAIPELKAVADYVTDSVTDDGLWKAFKFVGLIE